MMPKNQNFGVKKWSWRRPLLQSGLLKHVSPSVNMHTAVVEPLEAVFYNLSATKLHIKRSIKT
jgi:hypothetical protein